MVQPFSVYRRVGRSAYLVAFKDEATGRYLPAVSTRKEKYADAVKQAWVWYREGIPRKEGPVSVPADSIRKLLRETSLTVRDVEMLVGVLRDRGFVKSCVFAGGPDGPLLADYLKEFWDWDNSPYVREKLRRQNSIHKSYVNESLRTIVKHWEPYFKDKRLGDVTKDDVNAFADSVAALPVGHQRKNKIMLVGCIPLRWAYRKEKIPLDVTLGLVMFSGRERKRKILTPDIVTKIFSLEWPDCRAKAANMLAAVTGLRSGEIQALRAGDLGEGCLYIRHSWNRVDGYKTTKNNEDRVVELPFRFVMDALRETTSLNPHGYGPESPVFWAEISPEKPIEQRIFSRGLREALEASGMEPAQAREYTFHSWRHFFATFMVQRLEGKLVQSQTGHKTALVLQRYADHRVPGDREKISNAQIEAFGALLPGD
ncbi:MAG: tyrosine-type recombinase/integrase [Spirochaetaceae bacterium]|jgi:integrase|nr:tyrosine-type recombinase/integrase [Spirochaetaceae bacterium]